jgi:cation:H+ antiporter
VLIYVLAFVISAAALAKSSVILVGTLTKIAIKLRISEFLVGFLLIAVGSSIPELLVGIVAAAEGESLLSLGNIIGSNIANLTLILGIPALVANGIRIRSEVRNREIFYMNVFAIAPLLLILDGTLSRGEGVLLLLLFAFYLYNLILRSRSYTKVMKNHTQKISLIKEFALFGLGLAVLIGSADVLIRSGTAIATELGVPAILIGLFALALGTSLPELSFDISAALKRQGEILMGETLGSIVSNVTLVLGITAVIQPIEINGASLIILSSLVMVASVFIFTMFVRSQYRVSVKEGLILIFGYLIFAIATLLYGAGV